MDNVGQWSHIMAYDRQNVLTGERAYQVLREIAKNEDGSYSSEIARNIETTQQVVSEIIKILREDFQVLEKGKRTQAQYYEINYDGFYTFFLDVLSDALLEKETEELESELEDEANFREILQDNSLQSNLKPFLKEYVRHYLRLRETSTLQEMLFDDFFEGLRSIDNSDIPEWLKTLDESVKLRQDSFYTSEDIFRMSLEEFE